MPQKTKIAVRFTFLLFTALLIAGVRIFNAEQPTYIAGFSPIGALALFGGAFIASRWKAILFPLAALIISDLIISQITYKGAYGILYEGWYMTYAVIGLIALIGSFMLKKITLLNVIGAGIIAATFHWIISDTLVWLTGGIDITTGLPLSKDFKGWAQCIAQGFPFMQKFLAGTLVYSGILFGIYAWGINRYPSLITASPKNKLAA